MNRSPSRHCRAILRSPAIHLHLHAYCALASSIHCLRSLMQLTLRSILAATEGVVASSAIQWQQTNVIVRSCVCSEYHNVQNSKQTMYDTIRYKKPSYRRDSAGLRSLGRSKAIQSHWFWYQSKARMRLLLVNNTNLDPISHRLPSHRIDQIIAFDRGASL